MNSRQETIIITGVLLVTGVIVAACVKGVSQTGDQNTGTAGGIDAVMSAIEADAVPLAVGLAIAAISLYLPPPFDLVGIAAGGGAAFYGINNRLNP